MGPGDTVAGPKSEKSNGGKYENFASQTDGQTDGAGFIGPPVGRTGPKIRNVF